jgi:hypothetical protein
MERYPKCKECNRRQAKTRDGLCLDCLHDWVRSSTPISGHRRVSETKGRTQIDSGGKANVDTTEEQN